MIKTVDLRIFYTYHFTQLQTVLSVDERPKVCIASVAIHLGHERSWLAFSMKHDPVDITLFKWTPRPWNGMSVFTSTCLLVNPQKHFDSFGFEAENKYDNLTENGEQHGWMLFKGFTSVFNNVEVFT